MNAADLQYLIAWIVRGTARAFGVYLQEEDVEDMTQDVLLRLWERPPRRAAKHRRAYVCRVARNLTVDTLRFQSAAKRSAALTVPPDEASGIGERTADSLTRLIHRDELQQRLSGCRAHLSDKRLRIFLLVYLNGLNSKEAARLTKQSVSSIDSAIHRARKQLEEHGIHVERRPQ